MNTCGRIPQGRERGMYTKSGIINSRQGGGDSNVRERTGKGNRRFKSPIIKSKRQRLEAKHSLQYFLLRQKTPPVITNTAGIMTIRPHGKR
jgi:hypothetical protein